MPIPTLNCIILLASSKNPTRNNRTVPPSPPLHRRSTSHLPLPSPVSRLPTPDPLSTWFFVDLTASIPFDVIVLWFVKNISNEGLNALGLLRTPRLLRLGRLLRYFDRMKGANIVRMVRGGGGGGGGSCRAAAHHC